MSLGVGGPASLNRDNLNYNVLSASPSMGVWALSTSIQLKIGLLSQVFDVAFDESRQWTMPDINPIINRSPEAIALCRKQSTLLILQEELQHRRIMDLVPQ